MTNQQTPEPSNSTEPSNSKEPKTSLKPPKSGEGKKMSLSDFIGIIALVVAIPGGIGWFTFGRDLDQKLSPTLTYTNEQHKVTMSYPESWEPIDGNLSDFTTEIVEFKPKSQDKKPNICPAYFTVSLENLNGEVIGLNEYKERFKKKITNNNPTIKFQDSETETLLLYSPAYKLTYSGEDKLPNPDSKKDKLPSNKKCNLKVMEIGTIKDGKAYFATYKADIQEFDKYLPTAEKMVESLKFSNTKD
jgi:eukaryotic-like serine/threonine-protein kinase